MPTDLALSVVMATYNRAQTIRTTLAHLADQSLDPARYEVIVVDDGSPDETRQVVEDWIKKAPFRLRYLHHANRGPGYTQNCGLREADAPLVLLMADDIWMSRDALTAHLAMHEAHPAQHVAALGRVEQSPYLRSSVFLQTWDPFRFSDMDNTTELPYYKFWACNISAKRDFLLRYGPFREPMGAAGPAAHEDPELGYRLSQAGLQILYCPQALGYHHHLVTLQDACKRAYMQGKNFPPFRARVGEPEIAVAYHWIDRSTLADHWHACFGPRRQYLAPSDRRLGRLLVRYALRGLAFNRLTVRMFWQPMADFAERKAAVARRMRPSFYRGMIAHHFFNGCRDGRALRGTPIEPGLSQGEPSGPAATA